MELKDWRGASGKFTYRKDSPIRKEIFLEKRDDKYLVQIDSFAKDGWYKRRKIYSRNFKTK